MAEADRAPDDILPLHNALTRSLRAAAVKQGRSEFLSLWARHGLGLAAREGGGSRRPSAAGDGDGGPRTGDDGGLNPAADTETSMTRTAAHELTDAVQLYLDLMFDCDISRFDRVFAPTSQLHGFRDGQMTCWPAARYKDVLAARQSPKSLGAPREEQILLLDIAAPSQALVKVRVRINQNVFVDYLSYHRIDGSWLITAKAYHLERVV